MKKIVSLATMLSLLFSLFQPVVTFAEENGEKSTETTVSTPVEKTTEANVVVGAPSENALEKANKEITVEKTTEPTVAATSAPTPSENTVTKPTQPEAVDTVLHTSKVSMSTKIFLKEKTGKDTDWRRTIDLEKTFKGLSVVPENVRDIKPYEAELISISDDTYFVSLRGTTGRQKTTLASSGDLQNKLKGGKMWPKSDPNQEKAILDNIDQYFTPSWASSEGFRKYHEIKEGDTVIAYTLQDSTYTWIYASAKKKAEPSQPTEPAKPVNLKTFYTSNGKKADLVMKDDGSLDFDTTKEKLQKLLVEYADELANIDENGKTLKEIAEKFAAKATEKDIEIIKIEGEDLLFVNLGTSTKVFFANENSIFKNAFKGGKRFEQTLAFKDPVAPSWTDPQKTLVKYNEVEKDGKLIGYTVKNDAFQWFYVPADTTTPPPAVVTKKFYTSNNNEFAVIMKDDNTVDVEASKKLLADKLDSIANEKDKELAEDFVKNATDANIEIKTIEGVDILFVKTKNNTKAFAGTPDSIFKDAFKEGTTGKPDFDKDKIIAPKWTKTTKDVVKYNKVGDIGYTLKNSDNDWYFAPKAKPQNKPNNGGGSSGGGSSGGGSSYSGGGSSSSSSSSSSASKVTPTKTTEVKGDEAVRVFALTGAVNPTITTLDDARLDEFMKKNNIAVADKNIGMTRAEVVKLLAQVTGQKTDSVDVAKLQYADVGKNTEYAKYIAFATENKIVSGYEDGTFRPNNIISRAELMKVLVNSIGYKLADKQTQFTDVEATHTLALYIQTAYNNKIINGVTATTFEPNRAITKGEFAKIIYNILYTK